MRTVKKHHHVCVVEGLLARKTVPRQAHGALGETVRTASRVCEAVERMHHDDVVVRQLRMESDPYVRVEPDAEMVRAAYVRDPDAGPHEQKAMTHRLLEEHVVFAAVAKLRWSQNLKTSLRY